MITPVAKKKNRHSDNHKELLYTLVYASIVRCSLFVLKMQGKRAPSYTSILTNFNLMQLSIMSSSVQSKYEHG